MLSYQSDRQRARRSRVPVVTTPDEAGLDRNTLLARLLAAHGPQLAGQLRAQRFARGDTLLDAGAPVLRVWFPLDSVVSLTLAFPEGGAAETATIGCEGVAGSVAALASGQAPARHVVQVAGHAAALDADRFRSLFGRQPGFRAHCLRYHEALFGQILHTAACNALHGVAERLARSLLTFQDRTGGAAVLRLTQGFLAETLGVHRPTVTLAVQGLQSRGLIRYQRGAAEVLDRPGLEQASCACYARVRDLYGRLDVTC
jgi:CRP-like cAMP-binding protein